MLLLALPFGLAIGMAVGAVGGGGAVLAVPVLVYVAGLGVHDAMTMSLAIVAAAALTGAASQARRGVVCWRSAAWFTIAAIGGSVGGTAAANALRADVLLLVLAAVMLVAAGATWQRAGRPGTGAGGCPDAPPGVLLGLGLVVGAITGLVGVGGGFLVVPALALGLSFGLREAMATSMVVVAVVSLAALGAHLAAGASLDGRIALAMGAMTVAGAALGSRLAARVSDDRLGRSLAGLIALVALAVSAATVA